MLDARRRRRGKQNPPASVAQTGTPRSSSRPESSPGIRSEIVPLPPQAPFAAAGCGRPHGHYTTYGTTWDSGISLYGAGGTKGKVCVVLAFGKLRSQLNQIFANAGLIYK